MEALVKNGLVVIEALVMKLLVLVVIVVDVEADFSGIRSC